MSNPYWNGVTEFVFYHPWHQVADFAYDPIDQYIKNSVVLDTKKQVRANLIINTSLTVDVSVVDSIWFAVTDYFR
jgi:hypothetical protein